jgi:hypothetical protein
MGIWKMKPAIALASAILVSAVTVGNAVDAIKKIHKTRHSHTLTTVAAVSEPEASPATCWRYFGGPKGGMWPAPCPGK